MGLHQRSDIKELKKSARLSALDFDDSLLGRWLHTDLPSGQAQHTQFTDDPAVPAQTIIGISWGHLIFNLVMQTVFIGLGIAICLYVPKEASSFIYLIGGILIAGMLYAMYTFIRDMLIRRPKLIISKEGIQTVHTGFHCWSEIQDEKIIIRRTRSARVEILVYHFPGETENLTLTPYAISQRQIERLLYVYRNRSKLI
ncbi:hypothetical protein OC25_02085 [Pedobacter kyungheensis]|uniref:Uncharacterized protein n=1 Tax=Pedobacter kyungheensis TaxID=1069985 RepID=A0A0C1DG32_9SPHI|nr:hypothetical protein [Pedobacter kyungheensis]KIA96556.1 hypothetical protein OC25_02085 [Pedobacter kyungheensis]